MEKHEIEKLRQLPIEDVAERLGLRVARHKSLCPFHDDHHASLSFNVRRNTCRCFVCMGQGMGTIDLVMRHLHVDFPVACRWLADKGNVILQEWKPSSLRTPPPTINHPKPFDAARYQGFFEHPRLSPQACRFLFEERRIDPRVARWCRLSSWQDRDGTHWLQIPYYDQGGKLVGVQNRNLDYRKKSALTDVDSPTDSSLTDSARNIDSPTDSSLTDSARNIDSPTDSSLTDSARNIDSPTDSTDLHRSECSAWESTEAEKESEGDTTDYTEAENVLTGNMKAEKVLAEAEKDSAGDTKGSTEAEKVLVGNMKAEKVLAEAKKESAGSTKGSTEAEKVLVGNMKAEKVLAEAEKDSTKSEGVGEKPRFRFPYGAKCGIYNLPVINRLKQGDELYITEGCSDCWAMLSSGRKAIAIPSATLLSPEDRRLLLSLGESLQVSWHMYPDQDAPGERLFLQLKELLPQLQHHQLPPGCKDFGEKWKKIERWKYGNMEIWKYGKIEILKN